jgi:hypothetical protein
MPAQLHLGVAATVIIVLVFLPIFGLSGIEGRLLAVGLRAISRYWLRSSPSL